MKYLSLFSGIGGFELGIDQATNNEFECIGYSEIDKYSIQTYEKNFNHKNYGDITKINADDLPDFDLIVGGFPCQSFSIAGKRKGFEDTRGTLFFEIARIIKQKQPRLLLLENVKGLLSHDKGKTFATIISTLDELGYDIQWQVLNSKNFGVPQNRERVFIIGHFRGTSRPEVFPFGDDAKENIESKQIHTAATVSTRTGSTAGGQQFIKKIKSSARGFGASGSLVDKKDITPTLTQSMGTGGNNVPMILRDRPRYENNKRVLKTYKYKECPTLSTNCGGGDQKNMVCAVSNSSRREFKWQYENSPTLLSRDYKDPKIVKRECVPVQTPDRINKRQNGRRFKEDGEPSFTLTGQDNHGIYDGYNIRRLTPKECERLQGFPDD